MCWRTYNLKVIGRRRFRRKGRHAAAGPLLEPLAVSAHRFYLRQRAANRVDDGATHGIGDRTEAVVNPQSVAPSLDEPGLPQVREVPRRLRLRDPEALVDVAHADLAGQQQAEDP